MSEFTILQKHQGTDYLHGANEQAPSKPEAKEPPTKEIEL